MNDWLSTMWRDIINTQNGQRTNDQFYASSETRRGLFYIQKCDFQ